MMKEVGARNKVREEVVVFWLRSFNTSLFISLFLSLTLSLLISWSLITTPLHLGKTSYSTDLSPGLPASSPTGDFMTLQKMDLALEEVVRMLLLLAGMESNPGPTYRMYLAHKPLVVEPRPHLFIFCENGGFYGDLGIFYFNSRFLRQLLCDTCSCSTCKDCAAALYLPDFSTGTMVHLFQLLTDGETLVEGLEGKDKVLQLQVALGCSGVSRVEEVKPDLLPGQCPRCLR